MPSFYKIFRASCLLIATVATAIFFVANRQTVTLSLFPLPITFDVPLFVPPACAAGVALILGYFLGSMPLQATHKKNQKELRQLREKNTALLDENSVLRSQLIGNTHESEPLHYFNQDTSRMLIPATDLIQDVTRASR